MSRQCDIKNGIHPRPCGMINLSNIISYGRGTLPNLIEMSRGRLTPPAHFGLSEKPRYHTDFLAKFRQCINNKKVIRFQCFDCAFF